MNPMKARQRALHSKSVQASLPQINRGIEREALRVLEDGLLSQEPHPKALGSKLTHSWITTDFSEAQLELITSVSRSARDTLAQLDQIHRFVYPVLGDELLWCASMPCVLTGDADIPLAGYGNSNLGQLKTTYRRGLGLRYGRAMQTISAVHYNFSLSDELWAGLHESETGPKGPDANFISERYFDCLRNFRRWSWLPIYLFGASPAVCRSFVAGREHRLAAVDKNSLAAPWGTSLRNGDLGYQSNTQSEALQVSYNSLEDYVKGLTRAIITPHPVYAGLGRQSDHDFPQVNDCVLQSEAEFYSTVRAKRVAPAGENFLLHILMHGVEYIEVRLLDVNPYHPLGIDLETLCFMDAFLLWCLIAESPQHSSADQKNIHENILRTVYEGRKPGLALLDWKTNQKKPLTEWAGELLDEMREVAEALDLAHGSNHFTASLDAQKIKVDDADATPSGRILQDMQREKSAFFHFAKQQTLAHREELLSRPLPPETLKRFQEESRLSLVREAERNNSRELSFDSYLEKLAAGYKQLDAAFAK